MGTGATNMTPTITDELRHHGQQHKGTELGVAAVGNCIESQDEALAELREAPRRGRKRAPAPGIGHVPRPQRN